MERLRYPYSQEKILVIEDLPEAQLIVRQSLSADYNLVIVESCQEGIRALADNKFDAILLDLSLPDGDGFRLCSYAARSPEHRDIPVICITAKDRIEDKAMGFSLGIADYLTKPFNPLELKIRLDSQLRKKEKRDSLESSIKHGRLNLEIAAQKAIVTVGSGQKEISLTALEFKLLVYMVKNKDIVLSREKLLDSIWGNGVNVLDRAVDSCIAKIRSKLGDEAPYIKSVRGLGYKFSIEE